MDNDTNMPNPTPTEGQNGGDQAAPAAEPQAAPAAPEMPGTSDEETPAA